jgi:predicted RNase H-like nuclease (RuvC/YqgF family)
MEFETQRALLEYLGKNPNDRNLVQRMIAKGKVYKDNGMYVLVDRGSLLDEVIRLREDVKELKKSEPKRSEELNAKNFEDTATIIKLNDKIKELESDLDFQISENERLEAKVKRYQNSIRNSFYYINDTLHKKVDWPTYKAVIKLE